MNRQSFFKSLCLCATVLAMGLYSLPYAQAAAAPVSVPPAVWWRHAVIYEVYPRSFQDANGDGIGDLRGITARLDYLKALGVDTIWLSPIFPSPQVDFGYDISNYTAIDPQYGTMADFENLVRKARKRGIGIMLDGVFNHTSDQHPWFQDSRSAKTSPKRDWYIWADGRDGGPPNNWRSGFGGSAWQLDLKTGQYYYHAFYVQQPDLNWRNPQVVHAVEDVLRFWLDKGVVGFRLDAVLKYYEDPTLKDAKTLPGVNAFGQPRLDQSQMTNLPEVHDALRDLRKVVDSYPGHRVLIGEDYLDTPEKLRALYGAKNDELQLPMDMQLGFINSLSVPKFERAIADAADKLDGNQPLFVFDNHDKPRSWDRYGDGVHNLAIARIIAAVLLTTRATPLLYEGQELGMPTTPPTRREDVQDPLGRTGWPQNKGRDGERTPMQWNNSANAGFSTARKTWLSVAPGFQTVNVKSELADPDSLLNWYRRLIALRKSNPALYEGDTRVLHNNENVLAYMRSRANARVIVLCNFSALPQAYPLPDGLVYRCTLASTSTCSGSSRVIDLPPFGVWIGEAR